MVIKLYSKGEKRLLTYTIFFNCLFIWFLISKIGFFYVTYIFMGLTLFLLACDIIMFRARIVINDKNVILLFYKKRVINIKDIKKVYLDNSKITALNIIYFKTDEKIYKINGAFTTKGIIASMKKTEEIVYQINSHIFKNDKNSLINI